MPRDLPVPGQRYTFGVVKAAQARGDFQVLAERGRRALRVHLGADVSAGPRDAGQRHRLTVVARDTTLVYTWPPSVAVAIETISYRIRSASCSWEWSVWAGWAPTWRAA